MNKNRIAQCCIALSFFLFTTEVSHAEEIPQIEESKIRVKIQPRKKEWKKTEKLFFDITVKNETDLAARIPYGYDFFIEVDGELYTQFPKPRLAPELAERVVEGRSEVNHGTITLGGDFKTVDAKTGKIPLELSLGKHSLVLICGPYRSNEILFEVNK